MEKTEVKIIGLSINEQLGIVHACQLAFNEDNRLIVLKGSTGQGKTTIQKALQLTTQGSKTLVDKSLYGEIDAEVQLLDGQTNLWVGCKSKEGKLDYVLYTKDLNGKKIKNPVLDGVQATPSKYLEMLQTELTWKIDELTSENPTVQKNILLKLYQNQLQKVGVIFDKKDPNYKKSILGLLDAAEMDRNVKDTLRKQKGGIADDLKAQGIDPDRPETCPKFIDISKIQNDILEVQKQKTTLIAQADAKKETELEKIKGKGNELSLKCLQYNNNKKTQYNLKLEEFENYTEMQNELDGLCNEIKRVGKSYLYKEIVDEIVRKIWDSVIQKKIISKPADPIYIQFDGENKIQTDNYLDLDEEGRKLLDELKIIRLDYINENSKSTEVDTKEFDDQLAKLDVQLNNAAQNNKIYYAVESFYAWRDANTEVVRLKDQYYRMLASVDTGVDGLKIIAIEDDIFLMYNGKYDPTYFGNPNLELRKLSSYSGTQKPVICLLIQDYLLNQKPKAMRYLYIDNIPIDNKTRALLEDMATRLDLRIFLNITGDFDKNTIQPGEILVEGGEVFFLDYE